jgi:hypothetical protein
MGKDKTTKTTPPSWEELRATRVSVTIGEFCSLTGWHRSRFHRHRDQIRMIEGFGRPMIPVSEVERILNGGDTER